MLLGFAPVRVEVDEQSITAVHDITGGLLSRQPTGSISPSQNQLEDRVRLESAITDFHPTLAAWLGAPAFTGELYKRVQATLHVAISRDYFRRLTVEAQQGRWRCSEPAAPSAERCFRRWPRTTR